MPYKDPEQRKRKHSVYSREHYLKNKDKQIKANSEYKKKRRQEWYAFKCTLKCTQCGFSHPAALDFHHEDPNEKEGNIHRLIGNGQFKKAVEEIKKCIVLCANCHRIHHHDEKSAKIQALTTNQLPEHAGQR
jgi:hypothetical protein